MKTAKEMRAISDTVREQQLKERAEQLELFLDCVLMPKIEEAANLGKRETLSLHCEEYTIQELARALGHYDYEVIGVGVLSFKIKW